MSLHNEVHEPWAGTPEGSSEMPISQVETRKEGPPKKAAHWNSSVTSSVTVLARLLSRRH